LSSRTLRSRRKHKAWGRKPQDRIKLVSLSRRSGLQTFDDRDPPTRSIPRVIALTIAKAVARVAGYQILSLLSPGAYAPGSMLSSAARTLTYNHIYESTANRWAIIIRPLRGLLITRHGHSFSDAPACPSTSPSRTISNCTNAVNWNKSDCKE
jgi:hypothetical protein